MLPMDQFPDFYTYCDGREMESDNKKHIQMLVHWLLLLGFHIMTTGNVFLCLTMIQKRKNIKTLGNLINTRGLRPLVQIR
jgi:hypothetical protein